MSTLAKLAKEIDETRDIGQTIAECQLAVQPSKKSWLHAELSSHRVSGFQQQAAASGIQQLQASSECGKNPDKTQI